MRKNFLSRRFAEKNDLPLFRVSRNKLMERETRSTAKEKKFALFRGSRNKTHGSQDVLHGQEIFFSRKFAGKSFICESVAKSTLNFL